MCVNVHESNVAKFPRVRQLHPVWLGKEKGTRRRFLNRESSFLWYYVEVTGLTNPPAQGFEFSRWISISCAKKKKLSMITPAGHGALQTYQHMVVFFNNDDWHV